MQSAKQISEVDHVVGTRVREARLSAGMTQNALAGLTGRSAQQIQKYETGENRVSAGLLHDLSIVLKRPITWFFGEWPGVLGKDNTAEASDFDVCLELLHRLEHSEQISLVRDFLEMMVKRG